MTFADRRRIVRAMAPLLVLLVFVETLGGQALKAAEGAGTLAPYLLVAFPAINAVGGNIASVIGSRITSALHTGQLDPTLAGSLRSDGLAGVGLGIVTYGVLAFLVLGQARVLDVAPGDPWQVISVVVVTGLILTVTLVVTAALASVASFRYGLDPDNVVVPIVTTTGDVVGIVLLLVVAGVIG